MTVNVCLSSALCNAGHPLLAVVLDQVWEKDCGLRRIPGEPSLFKYCMMKHFFSERGSYFVPLSGTTPLPLGI